MLSPQKNGRGRPRKLRPPDDDDELAERGRLRLNGLIEGSPMDVKEIAEAAGTTEAQISRLRTGERKFTTKWAQRLAPVFGIRAEDFFARIGEAVRTVAMRYNVADGFADAPDPEPKDPGRIHAPPTLKRAEECDAALVADDSADRLYPPGSMLLVRRLAAIDGPLKLGARVLVRQFTKTLAEGNVGQVLVGILDRSYAGDIAVATRSTNRAVSASVLVRRVGFDPGLSERFDLDRARPGGATIDYVPAPDDTAEIVGVVVLAITPEEVAA